jgi:DNA helicase-2/ATP-dependent DNA helicase PcrA
MTDRDEEEEAMGDTRECLRILGGPGCGKTTALLEQAREKATAGVPVADLLFIVPSEQARRVVVSKAKGAGFAELCERIVTIHQLCVAILDTEDARAFTGRVPRVLNNTEELFLLEDLKTSGVRPRRLREMLGYFYRCLTEMEDGREDFIQDADELNVMSLLKEQLRIREALLPAELSATAFRYLAQNLSGLEKSCCPHVLVDDYHGLNKASQMVAGLLALVSLSVTGNSQKVTGCSEPYPYPQGLWNLEKSSPKVRTLTLETARRTPQKITSIGNALVLREEIEDESILASLDSTMRQGIVKQVKWPNPAGEFSGIARYVADKINSSVDSPGDPSASPSAAPSAGRCADRLQSDEIFVGVPNRLWGELLLKELKARKVPVSPVLHPRKLPGNPQKRESSVAMRAFTALCLASDPGDLTAWRSWIGFGDHLLGSSVWSRFCAYCRKQELKPLAAVDRLIHEKGHASNQRGATCEDEPFLQAGRLLERFRSGREIVDRLFGQQGFALVKALEKSFGPLPDSFTQLVEPLDGVETAHELCARARERLFDPSFPKGGVRLGPYEAAHYLEPRLVVLTGLVNGLVPTDAALDPLCDPDQRKRAYQEQLCLLHTAITRSSDELVLSYFQKEELNSAGKLKLSVSRIRVDHGIRVAVLAPSVYFDEMGPALPGAVSAL